MAQHVLSGARLREMREAADLTPEHAALGVGRSSFTILGYERGRVAPSVATLAKLSNLYGCEIGSFFAVVADDRG